MEVFYEKKLAVFLLLSVALRAQNSTGTEVPIKVTISPAAIVSCLAWWNSWITPPHCRSWKWLWLLPDSCAWVITPSVPQPGKNLTAICWFFLQGTVTVLEIGTLFADAKMGITAEVVPDASLQKVFDFEFDLIRAVVDNRLPGTVFRTEWDLPEIRKEQQIFLHFKCHCPGLEIRQSRHLSACAGLWRVTTNYRALQEKGFRCSGNAQPPVMEP